MLRVRFSETPPELVATYGKAHEVENALSLGARRSSTLGRFKKRGAARASARRRQARRTRAGASYVCNRVGCALRDDREGAAGAVRADHALQHLPVHPE